MKLMRAALIDFDWLRQILHRRPSAAHRLTAAGLQVHHHQSRCPQMSRCPQF